MLIQPRRLPAIAGAWIAFVLLPLGLVTPCYGDVFVVTHDGRGLRGEIDAKTDATTLWVRHVEERIVLTTAIAWSHVVSAELEGQALSAEELRNLASSRASDGPHAFLAWDDPTECLASTYDVAGAPGLVRRRIVNIEIDAVLVNRDRDVEPDGLELVVAALDCDGLPIAVEGSLSARLWGERISANGSHDRFADLQRWSESVHAIHFCEGTAGYYLPFRTVRPTFDFGLATVAELTVRLGVHGDGNFEASVPVHVRHFDPLRDRLQLFGGRRLFRDELSEQVWR